MPVRVSATNRIRTKIDALFAEDRELSEILEEVARLGAQLLMQAALEAEVTEFLGRERYQRTAACLDANDGSRNGYRPVTVKTTTGPVTLERPKLRGTTAAFASRYHALETLVIAAFVRGLSVRDVHARAADSTRSCWTICFWTPVSFHPGSPAEPVLAAWGITTEGNHRAWPTLTDLGERGLPLLVGVSDGARAAHSRRQADRGVRRQYSTCIGDSLARPAPSAWCWSRTRLAPRPVGAASPYTVGTSTTSGDTDQADAISAIA